MQLAKLKANAIGQDHHVQLTLATKMQTLLHANLIPHVFGLDLNVTQIFVMHI